MKKCKQAWHKLGQKMPYVFLALAVVTSVTVLIFNMGTHSGKTLSNVLLSNETSGENMNGNYNYVENSYDVNNTYDTNQSYDQNYENPQVQYPMQTQMNPQEPQKSQQIYNWDNGGDGNNNGGGQTMGPNGGDYGQTMGPNGGGNGAPSEKDCKNDIRDARRMENELNQFIKFASKKGSDTSTLSESLSLVQGAKEKLQSCNTMTWDELQSVRETLMGNSGVQSKLDILRCQSEYDRMKKDEARTKKDFEQSKGHLEKIKKTVSAEMSSEIEDQFKRMDKMQNIQEKKLKLMEDTDCNLWSAPRLTVEGEEGSGKDYSNEQMEWEDLDYENQDLSYEMNEFWDKFGNVQETAWASQMFDDVEKQIQITYNKEYQNMPKELQQKFDMIASTAKELVTKGRECQKANDTNCVQEVKNRLDELTMKGARLFGAPEVDFKEYGFDDTTNKNFKNVSQNMNYGEATEVVNYLLSLDPTLASKISDPAMADKIFKIMGHIPENIKGEYLNDVGALKETFDQAAQIAPELNNYKEDILGYSYFGDSLTNLIIELKSVRDGKTTVSDLVAKLDSFKNTSRKSEVGIGVTKFEDATTDKWYYDAANKEEFNIKGKSINGKQMFDPAGATTFAEMLKVLSEGMGIKPTEGNTSYGAANNHWAKGYYKAVESSGVTLMDPNHKITRGEMARLVVEMLKLPIQNNATPFSDLQGTKYEGYIATLYSYGVIHGDSNSDTVRPNNTITRGEAFTLAKNTLDNLQYVTVSESEMQSYTEDLDSIK